MMMSLLRQLRLKLAPQKLEITVHRDEETGVFVASWDDPQGGGITTQADTLEELFEALREAFRCHFEERTVPRTFSLVLETAVLQPA